MRSRTCGAVIRGKHLNILLCDLFGYGRVEGWQKWTLDTGQCSYFILLQFSFLTRDNSLSMGVSLRLTFSEVFHVTKKQLFHKVYSVSN